MSTPSPHVFEPHQSPEDHGLAQGKLGVWAIVFFVMSAAAPLTVVASGAPLTVALGGIGGPGAIFAAGIVLLLFAVGFTAMSRYVRNAGAFYAYTTQGLGRHIGAATAALTSFGYLVLLLGFYGFIGYFADLTATNLFSIDAPWWMWDLMLAAFVGFLGFRQVEMGSRVLAVLLTAEVALLAALSLAVLIKGSPEPLSLAPFDPQNWLFTPQAGSLFVLGFGAYIGFEGTAIYAEEARDPGRTVPRATYIAIGFLGLFYAFTFYCFIAAFGMNGVIAAVSEGDFTLLPFAQADIYLGEWAVKVLQVLIVTSFLACLISFHNACSRYLFALGRARLLPSWLNHSHPAHKSPDRASLLLSGFSLAAILVTVVTAWDPYLDLGVKPYASGVIAIVAAQAICAFAVVAFFLKDRRGHSPLRVLVAPGLGALGLSAGVYMIVTNFSVVSGFSGTINTILLSLPLAAFVIGLVAYQIFRPALVEDLEEVDAA